MKILKTISQNKLKRVINKIINKTELIKTWSKIYFVNF